MAFIREIISSEDAVWFNSLGIRNWSGHCKKEVILGWTSWCIDRERNAFYMELGGGRDGEPNICVLWWDGFEIRIEKSSVVEKRADGKSIIKILKLTAPQNAYARRNEIVRMIFEAVKAVKNHNEIVLGRKSSIEYRIDENTIIECLSE